MQDFDMPDTDLDREIEEEALSDCSECEDDDCMDLGEPQGLSYIGEAAKARLQEQHPKYCGKCWNVTYGKAVGEILQTPHGKYFKEEQITEENQDNHSDFFPEKMGDLIGSADRWVDFTSLGPPDGRFLEHFARGLKALHDKGTEITVRILTGNIVGMPTDIQGLTQKLTNFEGYEIPRDTLLKIFVGSWRKGLSWNHAKIIAVDGCKLLTGGHNVWDPHYLSYNPVRDLSMELEGVVAEDGHVFANRMWKFIEKVHKECISQRYLPDWFPVIGKRRIAINCYPPDANMLHKLDACQVPAYERVGDAVPLEDAVADGNCAMVSIGRWGSLHHDDASANPSDSAITAMLDSAQTSIKMSLQDLGPIAIPTSPARAVPGGVWPEAYLKAIGKAIYERGVNVDIVVSNPNSIPANLGPTQANYGNGWTCNDVEAAIINAMKMSIDDIDEERFGGLVEVNLRVAFIRSSCGSQDWAERKKAGNHAKFFMIDDKAYYCGSQNLYIANLAEWGVVIDNEEQTLKVKEEYWDKLWGSSFEDVPPEERDADLDGVLQAADILANPANEDMTDEELEMAMLARKNAGVGGDPKSLIVWLKRANNLKDTDGLGAGSSDAYCVLKLLDGDGNLVGCKKESTVVEDGGPNPIFNEQIDFEGLEKPCAYTLKITVLDKDTFLGMKGEMADLMAADDKLGAAKVELADLDCTKKFQDRTLTIADGWFSDSTIDIALCTQGGWGN